MRTSVRVLAIPATTVTATIVSTTILAVTSEKVLTYLTTLNVGACTESVSKSIFPFSITRTCSSASLDAASGIQVNCITAARCLQSSGTTAGTLAGTFDDEIDLAGSKGLGKDECRQYQAPWTISSSPLVTV